MAFVDHEFALLGVGRRPAARPEERLAQVQAADRAQRAAAPSRKRPRLVPAKALRFKQAAPSKAPVRRRQFRPGR
jgi:hypothetical protein